MTKKVINLWGKNRVHFPQRKSWLRLWLSEFSR